MYLDVDLFTREGINKFEQDFDIADRYLWKKVFGKDG